MAEEQKKTFQLQRVYLKDASFECPGAPDIFLQDWKPKMNVQLNNAARRIGDVAQPVEMQRARDRHPHHQREQPAQHRVHHGPCRRRAPHHRPDDQSDKREPAHRRGEITGFHPYAGHGYAGHEL